MNSKKKNSVSITGIVPCFNASETLREVITSLYNQIPPLQEIIVIDDGSTDASSVIAKDMKCRVITLKENFGRGHSRNIGISECRTTYALFCDSTNILPSNFSANAIKHFKNSSIAAVFGRIVNHLKMTDALSRWRGRNLFREHLDHRQDVHEVQCLISYAVLFRKDAVLECGNFDLSLRKCEDQDIGQKLISFGYKIISDPSLVTYSIRRETMTSLCIRFNRWFSDHQEEFHCWEAFINTLRSSMTIFLKDDLRNMDFQSMIISIFLPFWLLALGLFNKKKLIG